MPDRVVAPQPDMAHYLQQPVRRGGVYPTLYLTRQSFESVDVVEPSRRFVVIRDLRDTVVSAYYSIRWSHVPMAGVSEFRRVLEAKTDEEGLLWVVEVLANFWADIQLSWMGSPDPLIRYEDLLTDDVSLLGDILLGHCRLPVTPDRLQDAIRATRFEQLAGRRLGEEDRSSHLRRGSPGDWRNHFTPRVTEAFKQRFADVLVATGYEPDASW